MPLDPDTREELLAAIPEAAARGRRALAEWDAISDSLCDDNHQPLDERYDHRMRQRDAEAWEAFAPFLDHGHQLLDQTEEDFRSLHSDLQNPDIETITRHRTQLTALRGAIEGGRRERAAWQAASGMILLDQPGGEETLRRTQTLRNAEGWHDALTWAENADVVVEINHAAHTHQTDAGRARTAQAEAARTRSTTHTSPSPAPPPEGPAAPQQQPGPGREPRSR